LKDHFLRIEDLRTYFYTLEGVVKAVDGISYTLEEGGSLGIVGESGCGKSVSALSILRLIPDPPGKIVTGKVYFEGKDLLQLPRAKMREIRGNRISMIFQQPMTSLNPVFRIGNQIVEAIRLHQKLNRNEAIEKAAHMLELVRIPHPRGALSKYPHELSGGMQQRVMIAIALSCNPDILIADEPTSSLDVTIQAQILDLIINLKTNLRMAFVLITHNLGLILETVERVIVMYAGSIVEQAGTDLIFENPQHPYTKGLLQSVPCLGDKVMFGKTRLQEIPGTVPGLQEVLPGCKFSNRCQYAMDICRKEKPELREIEEGHFIRCWQEA
jgi:peptide/nickel transport system ATP-binding protein